MDLKLGPIKVTIGRTVEKATIGELQSNRLATVGADGVGPEWAVTSYGHYYATSVPAYRAVKLRADAVAAAPLRAYQRVGDGELAEALPSNDPLQSLLDHVNPFWTAADLWKGTETYLSLWGSAFWFLDREEAMAGVPKHVWLMRPDRVRIVPDKSPGPNNYILGFMFGEGDRAVALLPNEVVWFRYFNPLDEYAGFSPVAPARLTLDMGRDALKFNRNFFNNGAIPQDLMFTANGPVSVEEAEAFYERLASRHRGPSKANRPMLWDLSQGGKPETLGLNQRDMEFMSSLNFSVEDAARVWGVPPPKMYSQVQSVYNNVRQADVEFYTDTISNEWAFLSSEVNELFIPLMGRDDVYVDFDTTKILPLQEAMVDLHNRQREDIKVGVVTINEVRAGRNLPPVPWGDEPPAAPAAGAGAASQDARTWVGWSPPGAEKSAHQLYTPKMYGDVFIEQVYRAFEARLSRRERTFREIQVALFNEQKRSVLASLRASKIVLETSQSAVFVGKDLADQIFNPESWTAPFAQEGGPAIESTLTAAARQHSAEFGIPGTFDPASPAIQAWTKERIALWSAAVNEETARLLLEEITDGVAGGESIRGLQGRVEKVFAFSNDIRSERIARTESLAATNQGHLEVYDQSGVVDQKMWLATLDDRVRDAHIEAHRQTVPVNSVFLVDGEQLSAPGLGGSAGNTINCRCTVAPVVESPRRQFVLVNGLAK